MDSKQQTVTLEFLRDRRAGLQALREDLEARLHAVIGGIAEYDWLDEQMSAAAQAQGQTPSEQETQAAPFAQTPE